jgi:5-methylcytosine-specific restriction endonuclease McrA
MRKYNSGEWTEARFRAFVVGLLRAGSRKWPPKYKVLARALVGQKLNEKTGRMAAHYVCASCEKEFPIKQVQVDHKRPVVDKDGFKDWETYIDKLFCESSNLQVLCVPCHKAKSKKENALRAATRKR